MKSFRGSIQNPSWLIPGSLHSLELFLNTGGVEVCLSCIGNIETSREGTVEKKAY